MDLGDGDMEFLELHYAGDAKLYVPVSQMHVISRYSGSDPDTAPLHTLGTQQWEKAKRRAAMQARDTAAELLALYAQRAARTGHAFEFTAHDYDAFADGFGFEETPDQQAAIEAVAEVGNPTVIATLTVIAALLPMLQAHLARVAPLSSAAPLVVANEDHRFLVAEQLRVIGAPRGVMARTGRSGRISSA